MGLLSELFVQFSSKGVAEVSKDFDTVEARAKRTSSAIADFGRQATAGLRAATTAMTGFTVAGLAGTTQGAQLTFQMQRLSREIASVALPVVQKLTSAVKGVADWFHGLSRGQQDALLNLGMFTVGATLLLPVIEKVVIGIKGVIAVYKALNVQMAITKGLSMLGLGSIAKSAVATGVGQAAGTAAGSVAGAVAGTASTGAATAGAGAVTAAGASVALPVVAGVVATVVATLGVAYLLHKAKYGNLDDLAQGKSSTEMYAESQRLRKKEGFSDEMARNAPGVGILKWLGLDLRPMSDQLRDKAIDAHRGRRDVALAGGSFEGITDTFRRVQSAEMRLGYKDPSEKTDQEILAELKKLNNTMDRKLEMGMA